DNEEFHVMTTRDYDHHYNAGVVIQEQLKEIGINAVLDVYDWPTVLDKQGNEFDEWDAYMTSASAVSTPPQLIALSPVWGATVNDDYAVEQIQDIEGAESLEEAQEKWEEYQLHIREESQPIGHLTEY